LGEEFIDRLRSALLRICGRRNDIDLSGDYRDIQLPPNALARLNYWHLLYEDDSIAEAALNPIGLTLARYLCGNSVTMGLNAYFIKGADPDGTRQTPLHTDMSEPPQTTIANGCNVTILCSDYLTPEDGPTVFVPGSHRYGRAPFDHEMSTANCPYPLLNLKGRAGSIAVWSGSTWHGSVPRSNPGLRIALTQLFYRRHMRLPHDWNEPETASLLARHPGLDKVLGKGDFGHAYPRKEEIPAPADFLKFLQLGRDVFA
jgi:ectoine hydroxylase-related dioxygenase (phytanoyl-CoA dioxygenase family)